LYLERGGFDGKSNPDLQRRDLPDSFLSHLLFQESTSFSLTDKRKYRVYFSFWLVEAKGKASGMD
jgi:hypothetical protein